MSNQNDGGDSQGPWGANVKPSPDLEDMVRQGQYRLKRMIPDQLRKVLFQVLSPIAHGYPVP